MNPSNPAAVAISLNANSTNLTVSSSTITTNNGSTFSQGIYSPSASNNVTLNNVTINNVNSAVSLSGASNALTVNNSSIGANVVYYYNNGSGSTISSDYNTFSGTPSNFAQLPSTTYSSLALWQAAGQDTHSSIADAQTLWDFGSYGAGTTPSLISNSLNPGTYDLSRNGFTMSGYSSSFAGNTSNNGVLSSMNVGNKLGFMMIFKDNNFSTGQDIISGDNYKADFTFGGGKPTVYYTGGSISPSSPTLSAGKWYFIALTLGSSGGKIYLGNSGTVSQIGSNNAAFTGWVKALSVGYRSADSYGPFNGDIAQMKVINHEPTLSELQTLYNSWVTLNAGRGITVQ
jgi:hypothetical protein